MDGGTTKERMHGAEGTSQCMWGEGGKEGITQAVLVLVLVICSIIFTVGRKRDKTMKRKESEKKGKEKPRWWGKT